MKRALIVANMAGFASFLISDIEILQKMGYEITYIANTNVLPWEDTKKKLVEKNVKIINIEFDTKRPFSNKNRKAYIEIKKILNKDFYELIHCHTPIAGLITRLAAIKTRNKGSKIIYTTHGFAFTKYSSKKSWLMYYNFEKFSSRFCDAIITINKEDYENAKRMHCKNVYYINGVGVETSKYLNLEVDTEKYRKNLGIDSEKIMILSVGELSYRKNHKVIIEAIATLENKDDYVYVICGNGIDEKVKNELEKLAAEKNVDVRLLGFRFDIPEIMMCSDIGAIPSIREGLGLAGIQSLAAGKPLIASNVQGINDYVIDNKTGFVASPYDIEMMATNIRKISNKSVRDGMIQKCKEIAQKFDIVISIEQRKKIYNDVINM